MGKEEKRSLLIRGTTMVSVIALFSGSMVNHAIQSRNLSEYSLESSNQESSIIFFNDSSNANAFKNALSEISFENIPTHTENFRDSNEESFVENSKENFEEYSKENFVENSKENFEEYSEVNSDEESQENSEKNSEDNSATNTQISNDDFIEEISTEYIIDNSIPYTEEDLFKFEATMYSECGAQGTSRDVIIANCWIARNKIEQEIEKKSTDPFRTALNANHYQGVYDDPYNGWRAISHEEGVITQELINSNPSIHEICSGVLNGKFESPIYNYDCCLCCKTYEFDAVVSTAESLELKNFIVIENGFFFHHSEWNELCNLYCTNY